MASGKAWDLDISDVSDADNDQIYLAVGKALTMWERLDTALAFTFGYLIGSTHVAALRAVGRIESPVARIHVIREAFRSADHAVQKSLPDFEIVLKQVEKLAEARNAIAHGQAIGVRRAGSPIGYYLVPGISTTRKVKHLGRLDQAALLAASSDAAVATEVYDYALNSGRILEFCAEFERLLQVVTLWPPSKMGFVIRPTAIPSAREH